MGSLRDLQRATWRAEDQILSFFTIYPLPVRADHAGKRKQIAQD